MPCDVCDVRANVEVLLRRQPQNENNTIWVSLKQHVYIYKAIAFLLAIGFLVDAFGIVLGLVWHAFWSKNSPTTPG